MMKSGAPPDKFRVLDHMVTYKIPWFHKQNSKGYQSLVPGLISILRYGYLQVYQSFNIALFVSTTRLRYKTELILLPEYMDAPKYFHCREQIASNTEEVVLHTFDLM